MPRSYKDVMLGPGGELRTPLSESGTLARVIEDLRIIQGDPRVVHTARLNRAIDLLTVLKEQAAHGYHRNYHRNPLMQVLSNPPLGLARKYGDLRGPIRVVGEISGEAHAILYRHAEDRKPYKHEFEHPTSLIAVERAGRKDVVITSPDGHPIWQDF